MGEQSAATRGLPAKRLAETSLIASQQPKSFFAGKVLAGRLGGLGSGGEVDEAVPDVVRRARGAARGHESGKFGGAEDLIDHGISLAE